MLHLLLRSFPELGLTASFLLFAFHLEVLHTGSVSFHEGILPKSQSSLLMVITLPDVSLLAMTALLSGLASF